MTFGGDLLQGGESFFTQEVSQFRFEGVDQGDAVRCWSHTTALFIHHFMHVVEGDASLFVQVEGVQDAVEGFKAPGVKTVGNSGYLQGAFTILQAENASGSPVMIGAGLDGGVDHATAGAILVLIIHTGEPISGNAGRDRHVREDKVGMLLDVLYFTQIDPHTEDATSSAAISKPAALQRFRIKHARIDAFKDVVTQWIHTEIVPSVVNIPGGAELLEM